MMRPDGTEEKNEEGNTLVWLTGIALLMQMISIFIYVPTERTEGVIQRIMYFHVPCAWLSFFAFFVVFICSILFLWKKDRELSLIHI